MDWAIWAEADGPDGSRSWADGSGQQEDKPLALGFVELRAWIAGSRADGPKDAWAGLVTCGPRASSDGLNGLTGQRLGFQQLSKMPFFSSYFSFLFSFFFILKKQLSYKNKNKLN